MKTFNVAGPCDQKKHYVTDLGLIKKLGSKIIPSNPIYAEVIIRTLTYGTQQKFMSEKPQADIPNYLKEGKIDINLLSTENRRGKTINVFGA